MTRICKLNVCLLIGFLKSHRQKRIDSLFIQRLCLHEFRHQVIFLFPTSQRRGGVPLFLVLPFVFISDSRGTLTATCRARCDHGFLSCALSALSCFSSFCIQYLEDTICGLPQSSGDWRQNGERRVLKVFSYRGMVAVGCVWRHACVTRAHCAYYNYIICISLFFFLCDLHLLFTCLCSVFNLLIFFKYILFFIICSECFFSNCKSERKFVVLLENVFANNILYFNCSCCLFRGTWFDYSFLCFTKEALRRLRGNQFKNFYDVS